MIENKRGDLRFIFAILAIVFLSAAALAIYAFPSATGTNTRLVAQNCNTENNSAPASTFTGACATTNLDLNDNVNQIMANAQANRYQGINMTAFNSSISNCGSITQVQLCYEWWFTGGTSALSNCAIRVDADGGASFTLASPACPGTTANPGETCIDVTSKENWNCGDFFLASGTRAQANMEAQFATANRPLTVDALYFNVTYTSDNVAPTIDIVYPGNTTYTSNITVLNYTATDGNLNFTWYNFNGTNSTPTAGTSGSQVNVSGLHSHLGSNTWYVYANDSYGNLAVDSHTFYYNEIPVISNITLASLNIAASSVQTIYANTSRNGVNDSNGETLYMYCDDSNSPSSSNTECTGGNGNTGTTYPYNLTCTFNVGANGGNYTKYCKIYDGFSYSSAVNATYVVDSSVPSLSLISVAGDTSSSYYDNVNDGVTELNVSGESGMSCKWALSDLAYSSMSNTCSVSGIYANCSITGLTQGYDLAHVSCANSLGNGNTAANNLDVSFFLDYTAPNTTDDSNSSLIYVPTYLVTILESDNVDGDPNTYYCTSTSQGCSPTNFINDLGQVVYTSSNRGVNYLRYYSQDDAGNAQVIVNRTVNINRLPVLTSASDNAITILGGTTVTINTISSDADSQTMKLYVCNQSGATSSGCTYGQYCSATGSSNLSCGFLSETDSAAHTWFAYLYDSLNESASANPLTGSYTTDSNGPSITIVSPSNSSYASTSMNVEILNSEASSSAWYSLDNGSNTSMSSISSIRFTSTISGLSLGQHNLTFYSNDSYGNIGTSSILYFTIISSPDTTAPVISFISPTNLSYSNSGSVSINISSNEALRWAGYKLNAGSLTNLTNTSSTSWNGTGSISGETTYTLTVYANDTSGNQGNSTLTIYSDTLAPRYSSASASPSISNESQNVNCSITWSDTFNITSVIIGENALGSYENHTIAFSGTSGYASYLIAGSKLTTKGTYTCRFYATDAAGNLNSTSTTFTVNDVTSPTLTVTSPGNYTYTQQSLTASLITNENASSAWYSIDGGANVTMTNSSMTSWASSLSNLAAGQHNIKFYANDTSGNIGSSSLIYLTISLIDTIPPVITITNIANLSYKGISGVALNITTNENASSAKYSLNGSANVTMTNSSMTSWGATLPNLAQESTNTIIVYANDTSGNIGSSAITFYADTLAPRFVNITATPSTANETQSVACNAFVNDTFGLSSVKISENSTIPGTFINHTIDLNSTGNANYTILNVVKGRYTCIAYATDAAGNLNSTSTTFTVNDIVAPTLTVTSPGNYTYTQQSLTASLITNENASSAWYSIDGGANVTMGNTSSTSWNYSLSGLTSGQHNIKFYANDTSGNNVSSSLIYFSISVSDTIPPVLTITNIANLSYKGISGVALNITTNENASSAKYSLNGSANVTMTNSSMTAWGAILPNLAQESTNTIIVYANDTSGNNGTVSVTFYADTLAPRFVNITATPSTANETQSVACNAFVNDTFGLSSVKISENSTIPGTFINHTIDLNSTGNANYTILNVVKGSYTCIAYATDAAGNLNSTSTTFTVNDVVAPTITPTSPSSGGTYNQLDVLLSLVGSENLSSAQYSINGGANVTMTNSSMTSWSSTFTGSSVNTYSVRFYATDTSGNIGTYGPISFIINTGLTDTIPPVVTITSISNSSYTGRNSLALNIVTNENASSAWYSLNGNSNVTMTNSSMTSWGETLPNLAQESTNTIIVYANDSAGNTGSSTITFYADTLAPRYSSASASPSISNESQNVNCSITWSDTFNITSVIIGENALGSYENHTISFSGTSGYASYLIAGSKLATKGTYTCRFYATDIAGNLNSTSTTFTVNDVTSPTLTVTSPGNYTYTQQSLTASLITNENASSAWYSIDGGANVTMGNTSSTSWNTTLSGLSETQHNIKFYANDTSGNIGSSSLIYFTVSVTDTIPPVLTYSGITNGTYQTIASPTFNITGNENLFNVYYKLNGGSNVLMTNLTGLIWTSTLSSLVAESTNTLVVYANDSAGNTGSSTITFYADTLAPRYSSASASPSSSNETQSVNCSITWSDTFNITSVIIGENALGSYENHTISFSGTSGYASYLIAGSKLTTKGTYTCRFYATDIAGNLNSTSTTFTVNDVTSPTLTVTSPGNYTYTQQSLTASLITNENASSAWYSIDGGANVTMGNTSSTSWNTTLSGLSETQHNIKFYANDTSGNIGSSSLIYFTVSVTDTIPPIITITNIANLSYKGISGVALNITTNENASSAKYSLNGSSNVTMTNSSMTSWGAILPNLAQESTNTIIVYANDTSGNNGTVSVTFYADTLAPRFVNITATPSVANETQSVSCNAFVNDTFGLSSVKISENSTIPGTFINHTIDLNSTGNANYTILNVAKGRYTCIAYSTDAAGNLNSTSTTFTVNDVVAPTVSISSPSNQTYHSSSVLLSVVTNENASSAWYSIDGGATNISLSGSGTLWSVDLNVTNRDYSVTFYANDTSGNVGHSSIVVFSADTTIYDTYAPQITIWSPTDSEYKLSSSVLLNITSNKNLSWAGYVIDSGSLTSLTNTSLTSWNKTLTLTEGVHSVQFYANDTTSNRNQGNRSSTFFVDLNNPSSVFSCSPSVNDSGNLSCSGTFTDAVGLDYAIISSNFGGSFVNTSEIDLNGTSDTLSYTFLQGNYTPGTYSVKLYLVDLSGRINDSVVNTVQVLDDTNPVVSEVTYSPSDADSLDPGVSVSINATVTDDYSVGLVKVYYKNVSDSSWTTSSMTNSSSLYNAVITLGGGNWTFYVNASDSQGNVNLSRNYTLEVYSDISQRITTNVTLIKSFTSTSGTNNSLLGYIILNTTSDTSLTYNVSITSNETILSRFNLNNTLAQTENYSASSGDVIYIPLYADLVSLGAGLYPFNMIVYSEAGTETFERNLYIQSGETPEPYLVTTISVYSASVTRGQSRVQYTATVTNYGTDESLGTYLNWTLPSGFTLVSGSLEQYLGNLAKGVTGNSGNNSITIDVSSAITSNSVIVSAEATSANANSSSDSKNITITDPLVVVNEVTNTVNTGGGGSGPGGMGGGGGAAGVVYSKTIEVVRGNGYSFTVPVSNKYSNTTLRNLVLNLSGFDLKYVDISPAKIDSLNYGQEDYFTVKLKAPSYKSFEEHTLKALISGGVYNSLGEQTGSYVEVQNIRLLIEEVGSNETLDKLSEAEKAIAAMIAKGYNVDLANAKLNQSRNKLSEYKNKEAYDLASEILSIKEKAISADGLIRLVAFVLNSPSQIKMLTGNVVDYYPQVEDNRSLREVIAMKEKNYTQLNLENQKNASDNLITGNAIVSPIDKQPINELLGLSVESFERGDYDLAYQRADSAKNLLLLGLKGNFSVFIYLYWHFMLIGFLVFVLTGFFGYTKYKKLSVSERIIRIGNTEMNIEKLLVQNQRNYFAGRLSHHNYNSINAQHQKELSNIRKERINLRNTRANLLNPNQIIADLDAEKINVESSIKKLQEEFYVKKSLSEHEYSMQFKALNERLAEIEDERLTLNIKMHSSGKSKVVSISNVGEAVSRSQITAPENNTPGVVKRTFEKIGELLGFHSEKKIKAKIDEMLKENKK